MLLRLDAIGNLASLPLCLIWCRRGLRDNSVSAASAQSPISPVHYVTTVPLLPPLMFDFFYPKGLPSSYRWQCFQTQNLACHGGCEHGRPCHFSIGLAYNCGGLGVPSQKHAFLQTELESVYAKSSLVLADTRPLPAACWSSSIRADVICQFTDSFHILHLPFRSCSQY